MEQLQWMAKGARGWAYGSKRSALATEPQPAHAEAGAGASLRALTAAALRSHSAVVEAATPHKVCVNVELRRARVIHDYRYD